MRDKGLKTLGWSDLAVVVRRLLARRLLRFGIVGGTAALTYALLGLFFVDYCALPALAGNALAYVLSFVVSYLGQSFWTFRMGGTGAVAGGHSAMLPRFAVTQALGLGLNSTIVWLLMGLELSYDLSMLVAVALTPVMVYLLCRYWVFRPGAAAGPGRAVSLETPPAGNPSSEEKPS